MLSKFIYRFMIIAALALFAQVGVSQNYVGADVAINLLQDEITQLQSDIDDGPAYTGSLQSLSSFDNDKISLQLMKTVREDIETQNEVKTVMDSWYEKANAEVPVRKTKLILALDKVKELLS